MHAPRKQKVWQERFLRSGYFLGALLLHLVVFLMVATIVLWKAPTPPPDDTFSGVAVKPPPPPVQPPSSGAAANNPQFEPEQVTVPIVTPSSVISTATSSFTVDAAKAMNQAMSHMSDQLARGTGLPTGGGGAISGLGNGFGSSTGSSNQLTGYFYDLKQTSDGKPTGMTEDKWRVLMAQYVAKNWDDSILDAYFKSNAPRYTDNFAISTRQSEEAPKAFGLEKSVQPALWAIHYHCKVIAPEAGEYRFVGFGDDLMEVKIKGALVLDAGWISVSSKPDLHQSLPYAWSQLYTGMKINYRDQLPRMGPINGLSKKGSIFHMDAAETVDMDVLIGDQGGLCGFYLLIEKIGHTYDKLPDGTPKLPFFQIGDKPAPTFSAKEEHPPFSTTPEPWQGTE